MLQEVLKLSLVVKRQADPKDKKDHAYEICLCLSLMYLACYVDGKRVVVFCSAVDLFSNNGALIFISSFPCGGGSIESSGRLCYWFVGAIFIVGASKSWSFGEILEKFLRTTGRYVARF